MTENCRVCGKAIATQENTAPREVSGGICDKCVTRISGTPDGSALLESINAPVLLMQGDPRQVITANRQALELFKKELHEVEGHRGGQVFDCIHAFTEAGCGKDVNCEDCRIKNAIVDTFTTATPHNGVATELSIKKAHDTKTYGVQVSTEKIGELALVRIDRYDAEV